MNIRLRLLQAATALLYMGPLMAGLSGYGWAMLPPFVSIFVLWLAILRPQQWPQTNAQWLTASAWVTALGQILSQVALVTVCFGIGRGIGGVMGYLPMFHPLLPLAISFTAVPMARLFWDSAAALTNGQTIDELMYPVSQPPAPRIASPSARDAVADLLALPDDTTLEHAAPLVEDLLDDADTWVRLTALTEVLVSEPATRHRGLREALVLWATEPRAFVSAARPGALRAAFAASGSDEDLLRLLVPRAIILARAMMPKRLDQFPDPGVIEDIGRRDLPADLAEALQGLASVLRQQRQSAAGPALPDKAKAPGGFAGNGLMRA